MKHETLTVLAIMSVLAKRTKTKISAAWELNASAAVMTWIVIADRALARSSHVAGRAFALPAIHEHVIAIIHVVDVVLHIMMLEELLFT
jgi:hypothetical protein